MILRFLPHNKYQAAINSLSTAGSSDPFVVISQLPEQGLQQGETLRWDNVNSKWIRTDRIIIADNGNVGIGGVLNPNYQVHIDNGDVFLATGSIGINEAPTTVHFLRISTNDVLPQTTNARMDLSYQNKTGTFQGLHIMSNTPKTGSNSLAYGVNVTLQGAATSGIHEYVAGRFKAVGATKNYAIKVHEEEGLSLFGTATELSNNAVVQIKGGVYNGNYYKPLVIQGSDSQFNWTWDYTGRVAVGRDTNMFEAINLQDQKIRVDGSSFNFTEYTANGIQVKTTYPQLSKNTQIGKTVYGMGRGSYSIMTEFVEGNAVYFNHYNTNRFSAITGREYMAIYTNGTWNATLDVPNQDTATRTAIFREGKVGIGDTLSPQTTLHIRETRGIEAFRIDTTLTPNFVKHFTNGTTDKLLVGGLSSWGLNGALVINDANSPYTQLVLARNSTGTYGNEISFYQGSVRKAFIGEYGGSLRMRGQQEFAISDNSNYQRFIYNTINGQFSIVEGHDNWYASTMPPETGLDIAANTKIRRQFSNIGNTPYAYQSIGDKGDSHTFGLESAEVFDNGSGGLLFRVSEFYWQNKLDAVTGLDGSYLLLSHKSTNPIVQNDLVKYYNNGDVELLQSGTGGAGIIMTDENNGTRHRITLSNGVVTVSAPL